VVPFDLSRAPVHRRRMQTFPTSSQPLSAEVLAMADRKSTPSTGDALMRAIEADKRAMLASLHAERQRRVQAAQQAALERAGIQARYQRAGFDAYVCDSPAQERVHAICRSYAAGFAHARASGANLLLRGEPGTGKTHLACALLMDVLAQGHSGLYTTLSEALRYVRSAYDRSDLTELQALRRFTAPDLLVLDEAQSTIGKAETRQSLLFDMLDARYAALRPTLLVTNSRFAELREFLGPRLFDRLTEQGSVLLECDWASWRQRA
jgi:DNA replication protein DnaC